MVSAGLSLLSARLSSQLSDVFRFSWFLLLHPPPPYLGWLVMQCIDWLLTSLCHPAILQARHWQDSGQERRRGTSHFYLNIIHKMEKAINGDKKFGAEDWFVWCLLTRTCKTAISHYQALRPAPLQLKCGDGEFLWFSSSALSAPLAQIVLGVLLGITSESVWRDSR